MSNKRITDLTELTTPTTDDVFPVVDIATNTTTKVQLGNLPTTTAVTTALATKQDTLVSGTNIKTLNSTSLLGSGNIVLSASPSGVAGAIQFSNGSAFASDAANLFYDDTNNRLGIGTNAPSATTHIKGSGSTSATTALLVQNSAGNRILQSYDDRSMQAFDLRINFENTYGNWGIKLTSIGAGLGYIASDAGAFGIPAGVISIGTRIVIANAAISGIHTNNSSILEVLSTTQGFLPPRMTTTQKNAIATPAAGLMIYDTTLNKLCVRTAAAWETITSV